MSVQFDLIETWEASRISGLAALHDLAADGFTGAVRAGPLTAFLLNGRVVGTFGGTLDALDDAAATAYAAPDPALPLLLAMQERGGETQAQYYTNETPLSEVDQTLSEANFTGYVELSENVLSGDYYVVYYGGRSMSTAFVGASEELLSGQEAFDRADDEVGIYEVVKVDVDVTEVPEPSDGAAAASDAGESAAACATAAAVDDVADETVADSSPERDDDSAGTAESPASSTASEAADSASDPAESSETDVAEAETPPPSESADDPVVPDAEAEPDSAGASARDDHPAAGSEAQSTPDTPAPSADEVDERDRETEQPTRESTDESTGQATANRDASRTSPAARGAETGASGSPAETGASGSPAETGSDGSDQDPFSEEAQWRETRAVPTLDPDESEGGTPDATQSRADRSGEPRGTGRGGDRTASNDQGSGATESATTASATDAGESTDRAGSAPEGSAGQSGSADTPATGDANASRGRELAAELQERTEQLSAARDRLDELETERDEARAERDQLVEERESLQRQVEELEAQVTSLESRLASAGESTQGATGMSAADALSGTNLFVRYASRSDPTLEDVQDGAAAGEVNANLRLDHHTTFDAESATVAGQSYDAFLADTAEYRFVEWLVTILPYEIRDTDRQSALPGVVRAITEIDRAELHGTVSHQTEEGSVERAFDVIVRDQMGSPLLVADINTDRDPVSGEMMEQLIESAAVVADATDLGAAIYVTASFFEPDALEQTTEATGGGLLSRDAKKSFVKTGRKTGYHLCLVESRDGSFYLNVPEL